MVVGEDEEEREERQEEQRRVGRWGRRKASRNKLESHSVQRQPSTSEGLGGSPLPA